jgi:Raf kinase inhibitor-like YbhB/YbcL family protein
MSSRGLAISSDAFSSQGDIPVDYTCDGSNINPPLTIENIPARTVSLVLLVDDPDASMGVWNHWVVWNIPPAGQILKDSIPGIEGVNDFGIHHYGGPCPPSGTHRYFFKVFALDALLNLNTSSTRMDVEHAMQHHILSSGELMAVYSRA